MPDLVELSPGKFLNLDAVTMVAEAKGEGAGWLLGLPCGAVSAGEGSVVVCFAGKEHSVLCGEDAKVLMAYLDNRRR